MSEVHGREPSTGNSPDTAAGAAPPPVQPAASLPATGPRDRAPVDLRDSDATAAAVTERRAVLVEAHHALTAARWGVLAIGGLLVLAVGRLSGVLPLGGAVASTSTDEVWARSLLALVLLAVALQLVGPLLVCEHLEGPVLRPREGGHAGGTRGTPAGTAVWALRVGVFAAIAGAVGCAWLALSWLGAMLVGVAVEGLALAATAVVARRLRTVEESGAARATAAPLPGAPPPPDAPPAPPTDPRLLAVGASGGGIRAAAFVLGGMQALQDARRADPARTGPPPPTPSSPPPPAPVPAEAGAQAQAETTPEDPTEPEVFAVSGGSYLAAALAFVRRFDAAGPLARPRPWTEAYAVGSPELDRLRRHTRYLFEPAYRTRDGLVSLALGAAVNLLVVGLALRLLAWVSVQLGRTAGVVVAERDAADRVVALRLGPGWGPAEWTLFLVPSVLCLAGVVLLTGAAWRRTAVFDAAGPDPDERRAAVTLLDGVARARSLLLLAAAGWLLVAFLLPATALGVSSLATGNRPVTTAAAWLDSLGFTTQGLCETAVVDSVGTAAARASAEARVSPDSARSVPAGACGYETTVTRSLDRNGTADPADDVPPAVVDESAARSLTGSGRLGIQIGGITALLTAVVALLRRGPTPQEAVTERGRWAALKRRLLTWLPLLIVALVGVYLLLLWTFHFLLELPVAGTATFVAWAAALTAVAGVLAYLLDANATSMHGFYRGRLADAFSVGVTGGRARELPPERVYRFSELGPVRLNIVTTLNSQKANEAPTMRGGFPLVFGCAAVTLAREERRTMRVPVDCYERFAGEGRTSIMAAVAISGAAISPLMGRFGVQMAPYRLLLTLFNLRVGTWVRNPLHARDRGPDSRGWLWVTGKPGLGQLALEAVGSSSADRRWIYLSDGGHLDNTGLVECVRHCVQQGLTGGVVVLDASNDPAGTWSAVGDAVGVVRADLDVDLRRVAVADDPPWLRRFTGGGLEVLVVKAVRVEPPAPADLTPAAAAVAAATPGVVPGTGTGATAVAPATPPVTDWYAVLPPDVQSFSAVSRDFPRASTARQRFGDLEFEAYRSLGYAATSTSLARAGWDAPPTASAGP